jgi:hypothetical protein
MHSCFCTRWADFSLCSNYLILHLSYILTTSSNSLLPKLSMEAHCWVTFLSLTVLFLLMSSFQDVQADIITSVSQPDQFAEALVY